MRTSDAREAQELQQFLQPMLLEPFYDAAHILRAIAGTDQERIRSLNHNEIGNSYRGDEFGGAPDEVSGRIESDDTACRNIRAGAAGKQFVDGGP